MAARPRGKIKKLMGKIDMVELKRERFRDERLLEVLGFINTPESRKVLETFAAGLPDYSLTKQAKKSLERLTQEPKKQP